MAGNDDFSELMEQIGVVPLDPETGRPKRRSKADRQARQELLDQNADANFEAAMAELDAVPPKETATETPVDAAQSVAWEKLSQKHSVSLDALLDLHGMTAEQAERRLEHFVFKAYQEGLHRVGVVTGKGSHSPDGASVLRPIVESWLCSEGARFVTALAEAPRRQGGRGVLIVRLRKRSP